MKIAIIGGGASGVISAISLLRQHGARIELSIFEPGDHLGAGLAYGTDEPSHLLNVPAGRMSCLVQEPEDFITWLKSNAADVFASKHYPFVPRFHYRQYLQKRLKQAEEASGRKVNWIRQRVDVLEKSIDGWMVICADREVYLFDSCWVATGYHRESDPSLLHPEPEALNSIVSAYSQMNLSKIKTTADVAIAGSGLSAIDHWRQLRESGYRGFVHFISRRGLFPLCHPGRSSESKLQLPETQSPRRLFRNLRRLQKETDTDWTFIVDCLRLEAARIWSKWDAEEQRQFTRHIKPYWEIARHRVPGTIFEELQREMVDERLKIHRARIQSIGGSMGDIILTVRKMDGPLRLKVGLVINATGAQIKALPRIVGHSSSNLQIVGPAGKSVHWEITAVPEIVRQVTALAAIQIAPSAADLVDHG